MKSESFLVAVFFVFLCVEPVYARSRRKKDKKGNAKVREEHLGKSPKIKREARF